MKILHILGVTYTRKGEQKIVWFNPLTWVAYVVMLIALSVVYNIVDDQENELQ